MIYIWEKLFKKVYGRSMHRRTLIEVVESAIIVEEELPTRRKNMVKYCQNDADSDEFDDFDEKMSTMKKRSKRNLRK
jgi:hypothetical protein